jgi:hypothetical protein
MLLFSLGEQHNPKYLTQIIDLERNQMQTINSAKSDATSNGL